MKPFDALAKQRPFASAVTRAAGKNKILFDALAKQRPFARAHELKRWRDSLLCRARICSVSLLGGADTLASQVKKLVAAQMAEKIPFLRSFDLERTGSSSYTFLFPQAGFSGRLGSDVSTIAENPRLGRFYHSEIDVLRFLTFSGVFIHHALPQTPERYPMLPRELAKWVAASVYACGWGVDLFFALSSYLITELLIREQQRSQRIDVRAFYLRRALRIWPLYYAFLTFTLTVAPKLIPDEQLSIPHRIGFTFFGANWTIARYGWPPSVASPLWSVSIEEQFYAVWPLIIKYLGIQRIPKVAAAMLITSLLTRVALVLAGVAHPGIYANVFARLDPIAAGALLAVGLRGNSPGLSVRQRVLMGMLAMAMTVVVTRYGGFDGPRSLVSYPAVTAASILIICAFLHREEAVPAWLRNQLLIQLGRMSYGLYVFHQFSLAYVKTFLQPVDRPAKLATYMGGGLVLTGLLAGLSYRYIERPLLALKDRFAVVQSRRV